MEILGLESLTYGVEDMDTCSRFNEDFGLQLVEKSAGCTTFRTEENATIILRKENDPALPPAVTSGSQLRQLVWSVSSAEALEQIAATIIRVINKICLPRPVLTADSLIVTKHFADGTSAVLVEGDEGDYKLVPGGDECKVGDEVMPAISFKEPPEPGENFTITYQGDPSFE